MITTTLDAMAAGGIHDQLGGGFARYSTDDTWLVPHFEKMLYDNALLTRAYLHGYLVTGEARYRARRRGHRRVRAARPARSRRRLLLRRGRRLRGRRGQVLLLVARRDPRGLRRRRRRGDRATSASPRSGNFVDPHTSFRGNILHVARTATLSLQSRSSVAKPRPARAPRDAGPARPRRQGAARLERARCSARSPKPPRRSTATTGWTRPARTRASCSRELRRADGRLPPLVAGARTSPTPRTTPRCSKRCCTLAELDDVAWLADARAVADELLRLFHDADGGGFFTTGHDAEQLVVRPKDVFDDATPSANSLAANGLLRLAALTGDDALRGAGGRESSRCSPAR